VINVLEFSTIQINQYDKAFLAGMIYPDRESIEGDDLMILIDELEKISSLKEHTTIDLILHSRGGNPYAPPLNSSGNRLG
jgi:hypothetical protein